MNYKNDQEFREWLKKNYTCFQCKTELFFSLEDKITTKFFIRKHLPEMTIHFGEPGKITSEPKDKGKYCEKCKEKLEKQEENWTYNLTNLTKPVKEVFSIFHKEKLRKMPIPIADQEKVIEFYKRKYCSPKLKCSQCGDYSVTLGEEEDGTKRIYEKGYNDENNIYCTEHIKGKDSTGFMESSNYLYDIWEEWKKENNQVSHLQPNVEIEKYKNEKSDNSPAGEIEEKIKNPRKNETEKNNNSTLFTILIIALTIETLIIFTGVVYWIVKKRAKK